MATLIDIDRVKYLCSCQRLKSISNLYYCKYCKPFALKCKECVLHEIDQKYFCANCFDNKTHNEASSSKFKCLNCFACPLCKNSLMMRASSGTAAQKAAIKAALAAEQSKKDQAGADASQATTTTPTTPVATKVYYLMCSFCRWTTRDVGIPDVTTIPGNWRRPDNPNAKRVKELLEAYKVVAAKEKVEKDRKKYTTSKRRQFHFTSSSSPLSGLSTSSSIHSDKYGILSPASRRLKNLNLAGGSAQESTQQSIEVLMKGLLPPAQTVENFDPLVPEDFFTITNVNSITTINQRHLNPDIQPTRSTNLYPLNKFYVNKESKRCNGCEHNVLKPESNITSIRFKLHQMAIFMIPDIRIVTIPEWRPAETNEVILSITNKCEIDLNISFTALNETQNLSGFTPTALISFGDMSDKPILIERQDSAKTQSATLKPTDVSSNGFVTFRRDNKIAIKCHVTPFDKLESDSHVMVAFVVNHCLDHKAVVDSKPAAAAADAQATASTRLTVSQKIFIDFGPLKDGKVIHTPKYIEDLLNSSMPK